MKHLVAPSVNICIIEGSKVLLSRRANTGWMDGKLCIPGGHVEAGETPLQAIVREIREELGVTVEPVQLEFLCVVARKGTGIEYVAYVFALRDSGIAFRNAEPDKCSELVWVDVNELPDDIIPDFEVILAQAVRDNKLYLETGF